LTYDNTCKYLAETYPADFVQWLLSVETNDIRVLKTELSVEPIRADSLTFLEITGKILHLEFQTQAASNPPLPFRMLDYYTRLKRQYGYQIEQVIIFLQETTSELVFQNRFEDTNTLHSYRVIRLWEQDPAPFLANPALLPFATLTRTGSPAALLEQVAQQVARIEDISERRNILSCADILAGLRFEKDLIRQLFREDIMKESVTYQAILQEGVQQGLKQGVQQGLKQEAFSIILRQLSRRLGAVEPQMQERIQRLSIPQLEELGEALLDFSEATDLVAWLEAQQS
jgi:predicted transposase YdaD